MNAVTTFLKQNAVFLMVLTATVSLSSAAFADGGSAQARMALVIPPSETNLRQVRTLSENSRIRLTYDRDTSTSRLRFVHNRNLRVWTSL